MVSVTAGNVDADHKKPGAGPGISKLDDYWLSLSESSPIDLKNFITS